MSDVSVQLNQDEIDFLATACLHYIDFLIVEGHLDEDNEWFDERVQTITEVGVKLRDAAISLEPIDVYEVAPYEIVPTGTYL